MVTSFYLQLGFEEILPTSEVKLLPLLRLDTIDPRQIDDNTLVYWGFLSQQEDKLLSSVLKSLGFEETLNSDVTVINLEDGSIQPPLPPAPPTQPLKANLYTFPKTGLFKDVKFKKYLEVDFSNLPVAFPSNPIILKPPTSLTINADKIDASDLNFGAITKFKFLNFANDIEFRLGGDDRILKPSFNFKLDIQRNILEKLELPSNIKPVITFNTNDTNKLLQINGQTLSLPSGNFIRLDLDEGLFLFWSEDKSEDKQELRFEWSLQDNFEFDFFASKIHKIKLLDAHLLASFLVSFKQNELENGLGIFLKNFPTDGGLKVAFDIAWIMAQISSQDLALVLPTLNGSDTPIPAFSFSFIFDLNKIGNFNFNFFPISKITDENFSSLFKLNLPFPNNNDDNFVKQFSTLSQNLIKLSSLKASLGELLSGFLPVEFSFKDWEGNLKIEENKLYLNAYPQLQINLGSGSPLKLTLKLKIHLDFITNVIRLESNTIYFYLGTVGGNTIQYMDFDAMFTLALPGKGKAAKEADDKDHDGFWDLKEQRLVLQYRRKKPEEEKNPPPYNIYIPGGNLETAGGTEWLEKRFVFKLTDDFNAEIWPKKPDNPEEKEYLRLGSEGISFKAEILKSDVKITDAVKLSPDKERNNIKSELVIINNTIRQAIAFATCKLPGFEDVTVLADVTLRKEPGKQTEIVAGLQLQSANQAVIGKMSLDFLQMQLDRLRLELSWKNGNWDLTTEADGSITFLPECLPQGFSSIEGNRAIQVSRLNLLDLVKSAPEIQLNLKKTLEIDLLDGLFTCRIDGLRLGLTKQKLEFIYCQQVSFTFNRPGSLEVHVELGDPVGDGITISFNNSNVEIKLPNSVRIEVKIGQSAKFEGAVSWRRKEKERFFSAEGTVTMEGFPPVTAMLKVGSGIKYGGQVVPNIAIFAAVGGLDTQLFSGVVLKELGAGIGINNRLAGISPQPTPESILANIDRLDPKKADNWTFVREDGFYLSIVAQAILASNIGGEKTINAYVASLILSLDSNLNIIAAGKLWLASSVQFVRKNLNRPVLIGAITLIPRRLTLRAALSTQPNPAIEANQQLSSIFNRLRVRMSFFLSPDLVEYYLEELSFTENFLGVDMAFRGSYRIAIFDSTALLKARLSINGSYKKELKGALGGFTFEGALALSIEYGGLLRSDGLIAYGIINADLVFKVSAYIEISFSFTIGFGRWKETIGYSKTFNLGQRSLRLGLRGRGAFDTRGAFGFDGSVAIAVSIFGYPLEIAPSLAFKKDVIDRVQNEVAKFERRLDQFKAMQGATALVAPMSRELNQEINEEIKLVSDQEQWLLYQSERKSENITYCLLVPKQGTKWLTPEFDPNRNQAIIRKDFEDKDFEAFKFKNHVKKLEVTINKPDGTCRTQILLVPWDAENWIDSTITSISESESNPNIISLEQLHLMFVESAQPQNGQALVNVSPLRLPEANIIFDPRVESDSRKYWTFEDQFSLPNFVLPYDFRSLEELIAAGESDKDLDSSLTYERYRRQAIRNKFHEGEDYEEDTEIIQKRSSLLQIMLEDLQHPQEPKNFKAKETGTQNVSLGYILKIEEGETIEKVKVFRGDESYEVQIDKPDSSDKRETIINLVKGLPIRQKFIPQSKDNSSLGKVVVKLPIKLEPTVLIDHLEGINHFQIYRKLLQEGQPKLIADYIQPELLFLKQENKLVVNPYLYTEEFEVQNNQFVDINLRSQLPEIRYYWYLVKHGEEDKAPESSPPINELQPFPPVSLYIPPVETFPKDLIIAFGVNNLIRNGSPQDPLKQPGIFQLIDWSNEQPRLAQSSEGNSLTTEDFELWVREEALEQSGFYLGSEYQGRNTSTQNNDINPRRLASDRAYQSAEGKFPVALEQTEGQKKQGIFKLKNLESLRFGYSYQFFIRPANAAPNALLDPLPVFIVPELPKIWTKEIKPREVERLELLKVSDVAIIQVEKVFLPIAAVPVTVARYSNSNYLRFMWNTVSPRDGGVEILIQDRDEPTRQYRQLCEVAKQEIFQNTQQNFKIADFWTLTLWATPDNIDFNSTSIQLPADLNLSEDTIFNYYRLDIELSVINDLNDLKRELVSILDLNASSYQWQVALMSCTKWVVAINQFLRSPVNIYGELLDPAIRVMYLLIRGLMLGIKQAETPSEEKLEEKLKEDFNKINVFLEKFGKITPQSILPDPNVEITKDRRKEIESKLKDYQIAKKLVAIIRRRLVCADEIFTLHPDELINDGQGNFMISSFLVEGQKFPREVAFNKLIEQSQKLEKLSNDPNDPLETKIYLSRELLEFFIHSFSDRENELEQNHQWWSQSLKDKITNFYYVQITGVDLNKKLWSEKLPQATGLIKLIKNLKDKLGEDKQNIITLIERPHHQLIPNEGTPNNSNLGIELSKLLPERFNNSDFIKNFTNLNQVASEVIFYFNLLERFGFAVDIEAVDSSNKLVSWIELLKQIKEIKSGFPPDHKVIVIAALEPDSDYEKGKSGGFPFIKLAVIPNTFWQLTIQEDSGQPINNTLNQWYTNRGFNLQNSDKAYLKFMGKLTKYWEAMPISTAIGDETFNYRIILVEPANRRWLTVPAIGERSHSIWAVPDRKGHRFRVALRRVSRYEPLIQWADGKIASTKMESVPPECWDDKVRVYRTKADLIDPSKTQNQLTEDQSQPQLLLPATTYPHPSLIRFSYQLPPEASRSLFNQISAIRTGYKGSDLNFEHRIGDRINLSLKDTNLSLKDVFAKFERKEGLSPSQLINQDEIQLKIPENQDSDIRLFRNERLVTLPNLPFFYHYRLNIQPLFETRESLRLNLNSGNDYLGRCSPTQLGLRKPILSEITKGKNNTSLVTWTVPLSVYQDHLTLEQTQSSPPLLFLDWNNYTDATGTTVTQGKIASNQIPDLQMSYTLLYRIGEGANAAYLMIAQLFLPWANGYPLENPPDPSFKGRPFVRTFNANVKLIDPDEPLIGKESYYPKICYSPPPSGIIKIREAHFALILNFEISTNDFDHLPTRAVYQFIRDNSSAIYPKPV
jgi:hypothetical protein